MLKVQLLSTVTVHCDETSQKITIFKLEKLSPVEDRGQTDRVDTDLWSWHMILTFNPSGYDPLTQHLKFKGQSVQKMEW